MLCDTSTRFCVLPLQVEMFLATLLVTNLLSVVLSATVSAPLTRVMAVALGTVDKTSVR